MSLPDGAVEIFADIVRFTVLDANGFPAAGANTWSTAGLIKATLTPVVEAGDDIAVKLASGDLAAWYRHGDMPKYKTIEIDMSRPDVNIEQALAGGSVITDSTTTALSTPTAPTPTPSASGGVLASGTYSVRVSAYNQYGETLACASTSTSAVTGPTGSVSLSWTAVTGAFGYKIYFGNTAGSEQFIARVQGQAVTTYVVTGSITPSGAVPSSNNTAGPGAVGYSAPNMGVVGNKNGVSVELFGKAVVGGVQATVLPYWRWVLPGCKNLVAQQRDFTNALLQNTFMGQAFPNPNWGTGPFGDWTYGSTQVEQRARCGIDVVPFDALTAIAATV